MLPFPVKHDQCVIILSLIRTKASCSYRRIQRMYIVHWVQVQGTVNSEPTDSEFTFASSHIGTRACRIAFSESGIRVRRCKWTRHRLDGDQSIIGVWSLVGSWHGKLGGLAPALDVNIVGTLSECCDTTLAGCWLCISVVVDNLGPIHVYFWSAVPYLVRSGRKLQALNPQ